MASVTNIRYGRILPDKGLLGGLLTVRFILIFLACSITLFGKAEEEEEEVNKADEGEEEERHEMDEKREVEETTRERSEEEDFTDCERL